jgi:hypothetical protein
MINVIDTFLPSTKNGILSKYKVDQSTEPRNGLNQNSPIWLLRIFTMLV